MEDKIILELNPAERQVLLNAILAYADVLKTQGTPSASVEALVLKPIANKIGEQISQQIVVKALRKEREVT